ncbi:MAG: hypothetical protein NWF05_06765 [Candidatus Bathyarchaeota archaeon]|nr:hypothetical protein [Candidatus Bathyarchaeota archaeon]
MSRKACVTIAVLVLFVFWAGAQSVNLSKAENIDPNQPRIILHSPTPIQVYNSSSIKLNLEILKPSSWCFYGGFYKPSSSSSGIPFDPKNWVKGYGCRGQINYLEYNLNGNLIQTVSIDDYPPYVYSEYPVSNKLRFSQSLSVPEGKHVLRITVFGSYATDSHYPNGSRIYQTVNSTVETALRVWYTSPEISLISPQSKIYSESEVPLAFVVDRPAACVYSLDGAGNSSLVGNTTLTGLSEGSHSLLVYATDSAGNVGKTDTVVFSMALPTPSVNPAPTKEPQPETTPTPTASPTNTLTPTIHPTNPTTPKPTQASSEAASPTASPTEPSLSGTTLAVIAAAVVLVVAAVVVAAVLRRKNA